MRRYRVDDNQAELVDAFEALGFTVVNVAPTCPGVPDLAVSWGGLTEFVEVKKGNARLRESQIDFRATSQAIVHTARTREDVLKIVYGMRRRSWKQPRGSTSQSTAGQT